MKRQAITLMSFVGDALALGPHWVYDQAAIQEMLGRVATYQPPMSSYHPGKIAGDFTHYGDQTLLLLRSIAVGGGFDLGRFAADWRAFWENAGNHSYRDGATRQTLENLQNGASPDNSGSTSHDIAGAARIGPLFLLNWENDDALIDAVRRETAFTHAEAEVVESAEFFARVILAVLGGAEISAALDTVMAGRRWKAIPTGWLDSAKESAASDESDNVALAAHGLTCHTEDAFPGICHLLLRHPENPSSALIQNATAGGDNAARGMILGAVYGAKFRVSALPDEWLTGLNRREEIMGLIAHSAC